MNFTSISLEYVDSMGDDLRVANAARTSFDKWKEEMDDTDVGLLRFLAEHKHMLPFRHPHITIRCKCPVSLARQLGKHQVGMQWSEVSRRYITRNMEFWKPVEYRGKPAENVKQGSGEPLNPCLFDVIFEVNTEQCLNNYLRAIELGLCIEQARFLLPQNMQVTWVWTGSLLALAHVMNERSAPGAQKDLKEYTDQLDQLMGELYPHCWSLLTGWNKE